MTGPATILCSREVTILRIEYTSAERANLSSHDLYYTPGEALVVPWSYVGPSHHMRHPPSGGSDRMTPTSQLRPEDSPAMLIATTLGRAPAGDIASPSSVLAKMFRPALEARRTGLHRTILCRHQCHIARDRTN